MWSAWFGRPNCIPYGRESPLSTNCLVFLQYYIKLTAAFNFRNTDVTRTPRCYARDGWRGSETLKHKWDVSINNADCGRSSFGHIPGGFWVAQMRLEVQLLRLYQALVSEDGLLRSAEQLVRSKQWALVAALGDCKRLHTSSRSILPDRPPYGEDHPWKP